MAEPTPFENVFNPDQDGTLTGLLGRAFGNQSPAGTARGAAMENLSKLLQQNGGSPEQAIVQYLSSPQGIESFHRDPNLIQSLGQWKQSVTPPMPQTTVAGPGSDVFQTTPTGGTNRVGGVEPLTQNTIVPNDSELFAGPGRGDPRQVARNAPNKQFQKLGPGDRGVSFDPNSGDVVDKGDQATQTVQDFKYFQSLSQLPPDKLAVIATGHQAVQGRYHVTPITDPYSGAQSYVVTDTRTGETQASSLMRGANGEVTPNPAAQPTYNQPMLGQPREKVLNSSMGDGQVDLNKLLADDKASMFLGTGTNSWLINTMGQITRNIDPRITDPEAEKAVRRNDYLAQLQYSLHNVQQNGGGLGVRSDTIKRASQLAPDANSWRDPKSSVQQGIQLYDFARHEYDTAVNDTKDLRLPLEERKKSGGRMRMWQDVLDTLPQRSQMVEMFNRFPKGEAGAVTTPDVIRSGINMGGSAVSTATDTAKTIYNGVRGGGNTQTAPTMAPGPQTRAQTQPGQAISPPVAPAAAPQAQTSAAPAAEPAKSKMDFSKMGENDIVGLNPSKLSPPELTQYKQRLDELIAEKKKASQAPERRSEGPQSNTQVAEQRVRPQVGGQPIHRRVTIEEKYGHS